MVRKSKAPAICLIWLLIQIAMQYENRCDPLKAGGVTQKQATSLGDWAGAQIRYLRLRVPRCSLTD